MRGSPQQKEPEFAPVLGGLAREQVLDHEKGVLLVLGGPGTGKTTLLARAACRVSARSPKSRVTSGGGASLVIAPNRPAADRMRTIMASRLHQGVLPTVTTFHALALSIVTEFGDGEFELIGASQQDSQLRELLAFAVAEGRVNWPAELSEAVGTYGMAAQVRLLIARAQAVGFGKKELSQAAALAQMPVWKSVSEFLGEYLDVLDAQGVVDYAELVRRALSLATRPEIRRKLQGRFAAIYVDDAHDADAAQLRLIQALAGPSNTAVLAADPDQSLYRFRGSDIEFVLAELSELADDIVVLQQGHRCGRLITQVGRSIVGRVNAVGVPARLRQSHRLPAAAHAGDSVEVVTADSDTAQATIIAERIARAKAHGVIARWSDAAIIVHSLGNGIGPIRRAMRAADIPLVIEGAGEPLRNNRAVAHLIRVLKAAVAPDAFTIDDARTLLTSPMIGMTPMTYRALARTLVRATAGDPAAAGRSGAAVREEILGEQISLDLSDDHAEGLKMLRRMASGLRATATGGGTVSQLLWQAWSATDWPARLASAAARSSAASVVANADLDAVVELFDYAAAFDTAHADGGAASLFLRELSDQSISVDPMRVGSRQVDAVRVLTAHSCAGREWPMVCVAGVQEGTWPDLRPRTSLLSPERLGHNEVHPERTVADALEDERRLFYVACSRASQQLSVFAVDSGAGAGCMPSRFLDEVAAVEGVVRSHESGWRHSHHTAADVVASLRSVVESDATPALKTAAAQRLSQLAERGVVAASPQNWWGRADWTTGFGQPGDDEVIRLSGSSWDAIERCSLKWFLEHEVKARTPSGNAPKIGSVVHLIADRVLRGELPNDLSAVDAEIEAVWQDLGYEADWYSAQEREEIRAVMRRFLTWHNGRQSRSVIGTEIAFEQEVKVGDDRVLLRGSVDRLEIEADGGVHIIDLKTGRKAETKERVREHRQLSLYQLVATEGGLGVELADSVAGAELVHLRVGERNPEWPKVQQQEPIEVDAVRDSLAQAVAVIKNSSYHPNPDSGLCRSCAFAVVCPATSSEVIE